MVDIFLDSKGIAQACKINQKDIKRYVEECGLPAFQEKPPNGTYRARIPALIEWAEKWETKILNDRMENNDDKPNKNKC